MEGGGGAFMGEGGFMRNSGLVGVGVSPHRGVNPREYSIYIYIIIYIYKSMITVVWAQNM